jgi:transcriptional regulator with XRE-family HTH domain
MVEAAVNKWKLRREALNLTQRQVAKIVGVPRGVFAHFESGRRDLGAKFIESLENALSALEPTQKAAKTKAAPATVLAPPKPKKPVSVVVATKVVAPKKFSSIEQSIREAIAEGIEQVRHVDRKRVLAHFDASMG